MLTTCLTILLFVPCTQSLIIPEIRLKEQYVSKYFILSIRVLAYSSLYILQEMDNYLYTIHSFTCSIHASVVTCHIYKETLTCLFL